MTSSPARRSTERDLTTVEHRAHALLDAHRRALAAGDVAAVHETRFDGARAPVERDLFVDLVAAYGLDDAVRRMRRFWRGAETTIVATRVLAGKELEVYERLELREGALSLGGRAPSAPSVLRMVTLVREHEGELRVVSTTEAPDPSLRLFVLSDDPRPVVEPVSWMAAALDRFGRAAAFSADGPPSRAREAVLAHPNETWSARARGPVAWGPLRRRLSQGSSRLPGAASAIEVSLLPEGEPLERARQLAWAGRIAAGLAVELGAPWIYQPRAEKVVDTDTFARVLCGFEADELVDGRGLASAFVRLEDNAGWASTRGLALLGLPEVEVDVRGFIAPSAARRLVGAVTVGLIEGSVPPEPNGRIVTADGSRVRLALGRRGPAPGRTYGPFGALALRPPRDAIVAQSGTRLRTDI
jgi:hypothetical protein